MPYQHMECESEKGLRGGGKDKAPRVKVGRIVQPRMWRGKQKKLWRSGRTP
jgi:hypothetical protein